MTARCGPALPGDVPDLKTLWKQSFDDTDQAIDLFFDRFFRPCDCVVYREGEVVAAAAHMLPVVMADGARSLPCHYIYAAATLPTFRGRGLMGDLLRYAAEYGRRRGEAYSVLVPAGASLFAYYRKQGYQTYSVIEKVTLTREACEERIRAKVPSPVFSGRESPDFGTIWNLRHDIFSKRPGSLLWDQQALERAAALSEGYGGRVLQPDTSCYAYVRPAEEGTLEVIECVADQKGFDKIIVEMLKLPFKSSIFRLPVAHGLPGLRGTRSDFAMCRPLGDSPVPLNRLCYVGLPLD